MAWLTENRRKMYISGRLEVEKKSSSGSLGFIIKEMLFSIFASIPIHVNLKVWHLSLGYWMGTFIHFLVVAIRNTLFPFNEHFNWLSTLTSSSTGLLNGNFKLLRGWYHYHVQHSTWCWVRILQSAKKHLAEWSSLIYIITLKTIFTIFYLMFPLKESLEVYPRSLTIIYHFPYEGY